MDHILICDLAVAYCLGVPAEERARPQRLLLSVDLAIDFTPAARDDDIAHTIDYSLVAQRLQHYGNSRTWRLLETLAVELAEMLLKEFQPVSVSIEAKKFVIPDAAYVSARVIRHRSADKVSLTSP